MRWGAFNRGTPVKNQDQIPQGLICQAKNFAMDREPKCRDAVDLESPSPHHFLLSFCPSQVPSWCLGFLSSGVLVPGPLIGHLPTFSWFLSSTASLLMTQHLKLISYTGIYE